MAPRSATFAVAVIDGPCDPAVEAILSRTPTRLREARCEAAPGTACLHGSFVLGLLGARSDAAIPGLCPDARLLHYPLFPDSGSSTLPVAALAAAIEVCVEAGPRLINLSLAIVEEGLAAHPALVLALDRAADAGILVVAAIGNQGRFVAGPLISHPAVIPVTGIGQGGHPIPLSNLAPSAARHGVAAPGQNVAGYGPGAKPTRLGGSSVAAAVATGRLADFWARRPGLTAGRLRHAIGLMGPRRGLVPPVLTEAAMAAAITPRRSEFVATPLWRRAI